MLWWEREIYINLLLEYQEEKKQRNMKSNYEGFNL
jgi:hypothetical protein